MSDAPLPPVALFLGEVALRVSEAEQALAERALGGPGGGFNLATFQASEGDLVGRVMDLARTVPMMSRHRVIVVRELERAPQALLEALLAYAERPVSSTVLILTGAKLPEPTKKEGEAKATNWGLRLQNRIKQVGVVERFAAKDEDPVAFALERAERLGCRLDRHAAQLLVELSGRDLGRLSHELEKAAAYVGGQGLIDGAVIEQTASVVGEAEIWGLTGALVRRDADQALAQAHRLLEDGWATHHLLAMITWQFRELLALQDCLMRGVDPGKAVRMSWRSRKEAEQSLRSSPLSPAGTLEILARSNRLLNRSRAGDRRVFERLVMELATR